MIEWIEALTLGLVQGLTEFLPVSSDGHLNITEYLFSLLRGKTREPSENLFFYVILHLGTLTAVAIYYRAVVKTATKGLLGSTEVPPEYRRDALIRVGVLAFIATLPLVPLKLFFMKYIEKAFEGTVGTGIGFLITAAILLLTLALDKGKPGKGPSTTTWLDALLIGIAQMFAPLPGVSRSGLTVAAALSLGLSRSWAVGFSLLIMVPAVLGATASDLKDFDRSTFTPERIQQTIAATIVAGVIGYGAIIWLVKIVRSGKLWYFSVYLIVIGLAILSAAFLGKPTDARPTSTPDRSVRSGASGPVDRAPESGGHRPVARPDAVGARPGRAEVGSTVRDGRGDPRLVLV